MVNTTKLGTKFFAIISALSLVGAGALVAINPASAANTLPATETLLTFEEGDTIGADAVGVNGDGDPQGSFEGMVSEIADGTNTTGKVLNLPKNGQAWSGIVLAKFEDRRISTGTSATFEFDFYSPETAAVSVVLKVEAADANINKEISFDAAPGWNRYTQTISDLNADVDYVTLVLIPNFGSAAGGTVAVSGQVYAIDNVGFNGADLPLRATPTLITFEDDDTIGADAVGANGEGDPQGSFEGMVSEIGDAANGGGTGKVLNLPKNGQAWSGIVLAKFEDRRISTGTSATFEFDFYSPETAAVSVLLKVEAADANINKEISFDAAPGWNRYTQTISDLNAAVDYVTLVLIPNFGTAAGGTVAVNGQVYAIDNVGINGAELPALPEFAPTKTKNPAISGSVKVGKKLTAKGFIASWEGEPTLAYQWFACTKKGTNNPSVKPADCKSISGASATKLTLKSAQKGKFIRVRVTATNDAGSTAVFSDSTKVKVS
jgi:hypothetical protein